MTPPSIDATVDELDTPALLIERERLEANLARMAAAADAHGLALRPHAKTHKSVWIARRQRAHGARGYTVAKLSEAEALIAGGLDDIFVCYPIVGARKVSRLLALARAHASSPPSIARTPSRRSPWPRTTPGSRWT